MERQPAGRVVGTGVALFLLAILLARFAIDRNQLWPILVVALPVALLVLSLLFGFLRGLALVLLFGCTVLAFRWVVQLQGAGWAVLLLGPVLLLATLLAVRVARALFLQRRRRAEIEEPDKKENGEEREKE